MRPLSFVLLAFVGLTSASAVYADPLTGLWRLKDSKVELRFQPCSGGVCGVIETSARIQANADARDDRNKDESLRSRRLKGVAMLEGLKPDGHAWKGHVYLPSSGATYSVTVKAVDSNTLSATGCMAPLLCQTSILTRLP